MFKQISLCGTEAIRSRKFQFGRSILNSACPKILTHKELYSQLLNSPQILVHQDFLGRTNLKQKNLGPNSLTKIRDSISYKLFSGKLGFTLAKSFSKLVCGSITEENNFLSENSIKFPTRRENNFRKFSRNTSMRNDSSDIFFPQTNGIQFA